MDPSFQPPIKTGFFFHNHDWNADDLWGFWSACLGHRNPDRHERKARKNQHLADLVDTVIGINQQTKRILQKILGYIFTLIISIAMLHIAQSTYDVYKKIVRLF